MGAGSTRLMELHTNRAAKHRYGKQRCKTSNMTVSSENMNLQIRSMFDAEPTSTELISSRNALSSDLVINETPKLRTQPIREWHSRNERQTPHVPAQAELPPQECGDNSTKQGGMPKLPLGR